MANEYRRSMEVGYKWTEEMKRFGATYNLLKRIEVKFDMGLEQIDFESEDKSPLKAMHLSFKT